MIVSVVGIGKAGLPLACVMAEAGVKVIGVGRNKNKINQLKSKINLIPEEPGISELLEKHIGKNLEFTSDAVGAAKKSNVHIVIVPLKIDDNKDCNFSNLEEALNNIAKGLKKNDLVILETTVPVGTTERLAKDILERISKLKLGKDFYLAYSPERIMTGYSISRYREFPKVIAGYDKKSSEIAFQLYSKFCKKLNKVSSIKAAEFVKIAEGVYRDVNIALANELYEICKEIGINYWEIKEMSKHEFCNLHEPGSVGGHCIPIYPWFLIKKFNSHLIKVARSINDGVIDKYVALAKSKVANNGKIGVIGLTFREGVKELAYSQCLNLIKKLKEAGFTIFVMDPLYSDQEIRNLGYTPLTKLDEMDMVFIMNKYFDLKQSFKKYKGNIFDVKNVLGNI